MEELSSFLKIPKSSIYKMTYRKLIPHLRIGRRILFLDSEITTWITTHKTH
ncbi:helix-turn-helix domain-containing protein [Seleniivibrio woodruffii]|uniref:helix-turn-helix domain-containing protein n=1 Tax=Seleniivibrio woodruffii TaxID=1078050 RepID=UPI003C705855